MEPLSFLAGALVLLIGILLGRSLLFRRRPRSAKPPPAVCEGCGHSLSYHEDDTCHAEEKRSLYSKSGSYKGKHYVRCQCRRYVGHVPAERMLASFPLPERKDPQ